MFGKKLNGAFSCKLHKIEIKREMLKRGRVTFDDENDDNEKNKCSRNKRKLKRQPTLSSVPENTKGTKITSEMSIIEEVRKLHEAYQFILCEHQRKLEAKKRRNTSSVK